MKEVLKILNDKYEGFVSYNIETNEITIKTFISYKYIYNLLNEKCVILKYSLYPSDRKIVIIVLTRKNNE
jgi:hypothetical protein